MSDPFRDNPNVGGRLRDGDDPSFDLPARLRAQLSVKAIDPANGPVAIALTPATYERILVALEAAREAVPWVGVNEIRDRLEKALS